jgi:hypothetical protein
MNRLPATLILSSLVLLGAAGVLAAEEGSPPDLHIQIPEKPFGELPTPPAPDYSRPDAWAALPDRADAADVVPANDSFGDRQASAPVDVFYIHPTTYTEATYWNQPLDDAKTNAWTDESVIARQAAVFNACCRVYAPRYRQASAAGVYAPPEKNPRAAYDLAWVDVRSAFLYYLKHWNHGRPFILAGHSQGAEHIRRWLEEFGADPRLRAQLVVAYPIGIPFVEGVVDRVMHGIGPCRHRADTGCFVTWNSYAPGNGAATLAASAAKRYHERFGADASGSTEVICVNPLSFEAEVPEAPASWNLGALPATQQKGTLPATEAGRIGARCSGGGLYVDAVPKEGYAIVPLPFGMLHFNDYDLYYQNIRINAVARVDAWLAARAKPPSR